MWNRRSRRRGAGRSSQLLYYLVVGGLVLAAVGVLAISINPSLAFSSVALDRPGNIGVVDDSNGVVGLDVASSVTAGSQERLVTVTNNLNIAADITVSLDDPSQGTLYKGGSSKGDSDTVTLSQGQSVTYDFKGTLSANENWKSSQCSEAQTSAETSDGWQVTFYCVKYDSSADETMYKYSVTPATSPPHDLSHIVFGFENNFDPTVVSTSPDAEDEDGADEGDVKTDPVTSVYGLKFEKQVSKSGSGLTYTFTIDGDHGTTSEDHGLKYGPTTATVTLPGPSAQSDGPSTGETVSFTVESSSPELTGTITRSTTLQPSNESSDDSSDDTSNQAPTADFTNDRKGNSQNVDLDASPSSDSDGSISKYEWDIGADGSIDHTGKTVRVQISSGTKVKLIVTDDGGKTDSVTKTVN